LTYNIKKVKFTFFYPFLLNLSLDLFKEILIKFLILFFVMIKRNFKDVKEEVVTKAHSTETTVRWLITREDGPTSFATRRFEIESGGQIGLHEHFEDHHIYIIQGKAQFIDAQNNKIIAKEGDAIYIPPNEFHGIINISDNTFIFICVIPYK